jgi:hypothetical protein
MGKGICALEEQDKTNSGKTKASGRRRKAGRVWKGVRYKGYGGYWTKIIAA